MTSDDRRSPTGKPALSAKGRRAEAERQARAAAGLRENLAKRKRQQRARTAGAQPGRTPEPDVE
jgi:hypothetical protein